MQMLDVRVRIMDLCVCSKARRTLRTSEQAKPGSYVLTNLTHQSQVRMFLYRWSRPGASRANRLDAAEPFQMQVGSCRSLFVVQLQSRWHCACAGNEVLALCMRW